MKTPTIHLNGTARSQLQEQYDRAYRALTEAVQALNDAGPNARDYYVQEVGAYGVACREHEARLAALAQVRDDLLQLFDSCSEGAQQLRLLSVDGEGETGERANSKA